MTTDIYNPNSIVFSDKAVARVKQLITAEENLNLKLRVYITGGGCNGFQYGFTFDEKINDDDALITKNNISLVIDELSYQYLVGAEIDFKEDLKGSQFLVNNPNAATTCSCGNSFSV